MTTPVVKLGDVTLGGAKTYGWDLVYGTRPAEQVYTLTAERAIGIPLGVPLTLSISGVRKPLSVQHVYALEVGASTNPDQRSLRLADRRWLWARKWISSSFNVRRASGEKSLLTDAGQPIELAQIEDVIRYAKWSLDPPDNGATKWTAARVLDFVFGQLEQPYVISGNLPEIEIQDLVLEDDGASAVQRVLAFLPHADVYIDLAGTAVVVNTRAAFAEGTPGGTQLRGQAPVLPALARKHVGIGGDIVLTSRQAVRPSKIVVLFTPEVEVRFDSVTEGGTRVRDTPELTNVAPSPDLTLALSTGTVARGSYVPLATLFTAWGSVFGKDQNQALSTSTLAEYGTAAGLLEATYARAVGGVYPVVNGARVRAAIHWWRRLYQIDEKFVQRLSSIRATRVAIVNPATGTRARSEAYCDFLRRPNAKNPEAKGEIEGYTYGWWARGWAAMLSAAVAAPATVSVRSETSGVIEVEPQLDPWGKADAIILGYPLNDKAPTNDGDAQANRTGIDTFAQWRQARLTNDFQVATVLTVVPASPNNLDRFHKVEINAGQASSTGDGPPLYARVFPGVMTARFAWSDEQADAIKSAILRGSQRPETLMVNKRDVDNVALATAKAVYASMADGPDSSSGPVSVDMDPSIFPVGPIGHVRHGLNNGLTTSLVSATGYRNPVKLWPYLDAATRRTILRYSGEVES